MEYLFTDYGRTIVPILKALCRWGQKYLKRVILMEKIKLVGDIFYSKLVAYHTKTYRNIALGLL
ncbi:winged helix-turn-helix transcriptional regulator [aff. Roholtiella sp. LEGE 12411]|uniref:winged helix-turn-helix transcriptional regulator n=1 Tax=aff. Roholtiella sp. LEGE 12411 TaxID=1828822 RepID=UPI00351C74C9